MTRNIVSRIALVGGPSGGKTTAKAAIRQKLESVGYRVLTCPEVATDFIKCGFTPDMEGFQTALLEEVLSREERLERELRSLPGNQKALICDRGVPDIAAYVSKEEYAALLSHIDHTHVQARDGRYDAVVYLTSPAVDKPEVYTTANNTARSENIELAAALDARTFAAWAGHPNLVIIDNSTDMDGKSLRAIQAVFRMLGIPEPVGVQRKYVVRSADLSRLPAHTQAIEIVQYYLKNEEGSGTESVRRRGQFGSWTHYHTFKEYGSGGLRTKRESLISREEYEQLLTRHDPRCKPIIKTRYCFEWRGLYCSLDIFKNVPDMIQFEVEENTENEQEVIPDFLHHVRNVTGNPKLTNAALARENA